VKTTRPFDKLRVTEEVVEGYKRVYPSKFSGGYISISENAI
jgi:hypothetical protein